MVAVQQTCERRLRREVARIGVVVAHEAVAHARAAAARGTPVLHVINASAAADPQTAAPLFPGKIRHFSVLN
jgi:hypothetical protein